MAIVGGALAGGVFTTNYLRDKVNDIIKVKNFSSASISLRECYLEASFSHTIYYSGVIVFLILHEVVIYPVFHRCFPQIESLQKDTNWNAFTNSTSFCANDIHNHTSPIKPKVISSASST